MTLLIVKGNGIQQAFYQDPDVLYISLHVHEGGEFYPQGPYGDHNHCGAGLGEGKYGIDPRFCAILKLINMQNDKYPLAYKRYGRR